MPEVYAVRVLKLHSLVEESALLELFGFVGDIKMHRLYPSTNSQEGTQEAILFYEEREASMAALALDKLPVLNMPIEVLPVPVKGAQELLKRTRRTDELYRSVFIANLPKSMKQQDVAAFVEEKGGPYDDIRTGLDAGTLYCVTILQEKAAFEKLIAVDGLLLQGQPVRVHAVANLVTFFPKPPLIPPPPNSFIAPDPTMRRMYEAFQKSQRRLPGDEDADHPMQVQRVMDKWFPGVLPQRTTTLPRRGGRVSDDEDEMAEDRLSDGGGSPPPPRRPRALSPPPPSRRYRDRSRDRRPPRSPSPRPSSRSSRRPREDTSPPPLSAPVHRSKSRETHRSDRHRSRDTHRSDRHRSRETHRSERHRSRETHRSDRRRSRSRETHRSDRKRSRSREPSDRHHRSEREDRHRHGSSRSQHHHESGRSSRSSRHRSKSRDGSRRHEEDRHYRDGSRHRESSRYESSRRRHREEDEDRSSSKRHREEEKRRSITDRLGPRSATLYETEEHMASGHRSKEKVPLSLVGLSKGSKSGDGVASCGSEDRPSPKSADLDRELSRRLEEMRRR